MEHSNNEDIPVDKSLKIEDYFDLDSITEEQLRSIYVDLRDFLEPSERAKYED